MDNTNMSNLIFIDLENNARGDILSISYIINNVCNHYIINVKSSTKDKFYHCHYLHNDILYTRGVDITSVLNELLSKINDNTVIVGHCINTDISKIIKNCNKFNINCDKLINIKEYDTCIFERNLKRTSNHLSNVYTRYFNDTFNAHSSLDDVIATFKVYHKQQNIDLNDVTFDSNNKRIVMHNKIIVRNNIKYKCISKDCVNQKILDEINNLIEIETKNYYLIINNI
jgi:DNA polymerase III epsilon subunit-like protein